MPKIDFGTLAVAALAVVIGTVATGLLFANGKSLPLIGDARKGFSGLL